MECNGSDDQQRSISELDKEVMMEILSRVAVKTIFACRCVCKTWKTTLSDPHFVNLHFSTTPANLLYLPRHGGGDGSGPCPLHVIDVRGVETRTGRCHRDADVLKLTLKSHFPVCKKSSDESSAFSTRHSYSCNGLLCLMDLYGRHPTYVCNPLLGEYIALPKPKGRDNIGGSAFGFYSVTNQYKLIWSRYDPPYQTQLYTLGDKKWRIIGNAPYNLPYLNLEEKGKILVNGALHWVSPVSRGGVCIRGFHFGRELFQEIPGPPESESGLLHQGYPFLGELGGCLSYTYEDSKKKTLEIWVLKESWTKDFVINVSLLSIITCDHFLPIMIMDNGDLLISFGRIGIVLYSPYWKSFRSLNEIYDFEYPFTVVAHVPSFISLKDVAKGEDVKVIRRD